MSQTGNTRAASILREAATIVDGARNQTHGDKERSFVAIAALWDAYLLSRPHASAAVQTPSITPADVAAMMVLMKMARSMHGQHIPDHAVDAAGYSAIWGELREAEQRRANVSLSRTGPSVINLSMQD